MEMTICCMYGNAVTLSINPFLQNQTNRLSTLFSVPCSFIIRDNSGLQMSKDQTFSSAYNTRLSCLFSIGVSYFWRKLYANADNIYTLSKYPAKNKGYCPVCNFVSKYRVKLFMSQYA